MDNDLLIVGGILIVGFSFPAILNAFAENRFSRSGVVMFFIGLALVGYVMVFGGHLATNGSVLAAIIDIPDAFIRVIAKYIL